MLRQALLAAAIATTATQTLAADQQLDTYSIAGWSGGAYLSQSSGLVYCALWDDYGQGTYMWLGRDETGVYLNLTDPSDFEFQPGTTFWVNVRFDNLTGTQFEAYVSDPDTINIDFGTNNELIYGLRKASRIYFDDWGQWYTLVGTDAAVDFLEECYWAYN